MNTNNLPRIYAAQLLKMEDGDTIDLGDDRKITCIDACYSYFEYTETSTHRLSDDGKVVFDPADIVIIALTYAVSDDRWVAAHWDDFRMRWSCSDLHAYARKHGWSYAVSRTLSGLSNVRTYKRPGELIRSVLSRM